VQNKKYRYEYRLVTLEGDLFNTGGSISGGAYKNTSNLLGRKRELEELEEILKNAGEIDLLAIMLGTNDYLSHSKPDTERVADRMRALIGRLFEKEVYNSRKIEILIIAPPKLNFTGDRYYEKFSTLDGGLSKVLEKVTKEEGLYFADAGSLDLPVEKDGIHLTVTAQKPLSEYFWEHLSDDLNLNTQEGKAELVKTSSPLLAQITAPALAYLLKQRLSELVGIDPDNLAQLLGQEAPKRHVKQKSYKLPPISVKQPVMLTLVQRQIRSLLINPDWAAYIDLPDYLALDGDFACLANLAETIKSHAAVPATAQVLEYMRGSPYEETVNQIFQSTLYSEEMEGGGEEDRENFQIGMKKLLNELKYQQIETLKQKSLQSGLNENEKKLLLSLLTAKQN